MLHVRSGLQEGVAWSDVWVGMPTTASTKATNRPTADGTTGSPTACLILSTHLTIRNRSASSLDLHKPSQHLKWRVGVSERMETARRDQSSGGTAMSATASMVAPVVPMN